MGHGVNVECLPFSLRTKTQVADPKRADPKSGLGSGATYWGRESLAVHGQHLCTNHPQQHLLAVNGTAMPLFDSYCCSCTPTQRSMGKTRAGGCYSQLKGTSPQSCLQAMLQTCRSPFAEELLQMDVPESIDPVQNQSLLDIRLQGKVSMYTQSKSMKVSRGHSPYTACTPYCRATGAVCNRAPHRHTIVSWSHWT